MPEAIVQWLVITAVTAVIIFVAARSLRRLGEHERQRQRRSAAVSAASDDNKAPPPERPPTLQEAAQALQPLYENSPHPQDLESAAPFRYGADLLADPAVPLEQVVDYCVGANHQIAVMAAQALAMRTDSGPAVSRVLGYLVYANVWTAFYILRYLAARAQEPVIGQVLVRAREWWPRNPLLPKMLSDFIDARTAGGEIPALSDALDSGSPSDVDAIAATLDALTCAVAPDLRDELEDWRRERIDADYLRSVGRIIDPAAGDEPVIETPALDQAAGLALEILAQRGPRSFLVVGEAGAGKTTMLRVVWKRLAERGWTVFEASAAEVLAGQTYMGELEQRIRLLLGNLDAERRVVWYVPNFHELLYSGQHRYSTTGVLDLVLPAIESGRLCVVGETRPAALERVLQQRPRLRSSLKTLALDALPPDETLALAEQVVEQAFVPRGVTVDAGVLREAFTLSRHYLGGTAAPGNLIELLRQARALVTRGNAEPRALTREDLLATLAQLTGLPHGVLDERAGLDAPALRTFFSERVMGQPDAVSCLVDRIAMLKAGLTDPLRPIGVFLFAGPTGTGKTEVAKTLAEYLFGSAERMIRLDMSEFQDPASLARILGEGADTNALVNRIRKQPFSVVLLDEFEKAHPRVWDLFLQVFDDARLTDAQGNLADFRHSIIILTSNLGGVEHQGGSLGFVSGGAAFSEAQVLRVIAAAFRPEFINRLDRVVVFRPLPRTVMRDILRKELRTVLLRRGFRSREWAVEWEESALEFLLEKGFTRDLGARPLRRAIDQYLLAPLAMTIVEHRFPEGDQFLFVRSDGSGIQVEFVDPDAEPQSSTPAAAAAPAAPVPQLPALRDLVLGGTGSERERQVLDATLERLEQRLQADAWIAEKNRLLREMNATDFWNSPGRHGVLAEIEQRDSIEAGVETSSSLRRRIAGRAARGTAPAGLIANLAQQLYLLEQALSDLEQGLGADVFLYVEAVADEDTEEGPGSAWPERVARMYQQWARKRRMRHALLDQESPARGKAALLSVSGFGAHGILRREAGLHVLEIPDGEGGFRRRSARVRVAPQPAQPRPPQQSATQAALACLAAEPPAATLIVRRYRELPSPLVRDALAGWRTGRLDQVLDGDFDLMG